ncbi:MULTISPECIES: Hint domain-containing protein [Acetobacter]|uniref:Adhesin/invasin TibA autotransporter n=1 Tax=Acetobacter pomorum DM001 TaxID=945681 RepID=F1YTM0_9PROT|nr:MULTISPECIES: Hint domain-containing protein [Acetobacter]EGE47876.1 Adhesin/invasin TibA autotransporter [Acetobacter pomorum DM001]
MSIVYPSNGTPYLTSGTTTFTSGQVVSGVTVTSNSQEILSAGATGIQQTIEEASGNTGGGEILVLSGAQLIQKNDTEYWQNKGKIIVHDGGFISGGATTYGGITTILSGGIAEDIHVGSGSIGTVIFSSGAILKGTTVARSEGTISGGTATSGAQINVLSGGVLSNADAGNGGTITVSSGGKSTNTVISSGGTLTFTGGGSGSYTSLLAGGTLNIGSGTTYDNQHTTSLTATSGAQINVLSGGVLTNADAAAFGNIVVSKGGRGQDIIISSGGGLGVAGIASDTTVNNGGVMEITSGGVSNNNNVNSGGKIYADSGSVLGLTSISSGGSAIVASGATISGLVTIQDGGTATIWNNTSGTIDLSGDTNNGLTISGLESGGTVSTVISGWSGSKPGNSDSIDLPGVSADGASYAYPSDDQVVVTLANGNTITLNIPGVKNTGFVLSDDDHGGASAEVCFLSGSMIRTSEGDVAVEDIQIGDEVIAFDWRNDEDVVRQVVWVGKARATVRPDLPDDEAGWPVRILKDAIADGVPYKDMLITAEHCLFFRDRFVPVRMLVNGVSIFYDKSITSYDYYHVETEQHSVITADGMLTESYLDTGNRSSFRQEGKIATLRGAVKNWADDAGAPLGVERSFVEPLFRALEWRENSVVGTKISTTKIETTTDPDLHLITQTGAVIRPMRKTAHHYSFMLPPNTESVRIVSRSSRPSDVIGPFVDDRRYMGVAVADVQLQCAKQQFDITSHLQDEKPSGWHDTDWTDCAWTNGNAELPLGDHLTHGKMGILSMTIRAAGPYLLNTKPNSDMKKHSA